MLQNRRNLFGTSKPTQRTQIIFFIQFMTIHCHFTTKQILNTSISRNGSLQENYFLTKNGSFSATSKDLFISTQHFVIDSIFSTNIMTAINLSNYGTNFKLFLNGQTSTTTSLLDWRSMKPRFLLENLFSVVVFVVVVIRRRSAAVNNSDELKKSF